MMPTYDFETEADAIKRKQAIADAMQASALRPMEMPTQPGVKLSGVNVLAKLLEGYVAGKKSDEAKSERSALSQRYGDELRSGMEQYYKTMQGYEAPSMAMAPGEGGTPQMVKVSGDRKKAIFDALASNHPVLRDLAMQQLKEEGKSQLTPKDLLTISTPESVLADINNPGAWKPKRELKAVAPGEVLLDSSGNFATPGNPGGTPPWQTTKIAGDLYQQSATGLKKLDNAPKVTNNISLNPVMKGESKFMEQLGEDTGKMVTAARQAKQLGQQTLVMADRLTQLQQKGVFTGPTANIAVAASALADTLKLPGVREKLASSEEFKSLIGKQAAAALSGPGGGKMTDKDMELFLSQYPQLTNSSVGIPAIIQAVTTAAQQQIGYANQVETNLRKNYPEAARLWDVAPTNVGFPTPANAGGQGPGNPIPLDQYLKNFGGQ
jgi:hypothetical protein